MEPETRNTSRNGARSAIKSFLHIENSREFLVFLLFFLAVFFFWYLMNLDEEQEQEYTFRLRLTDVPSDMIVTEPLPEYVTVSVRDKGEKILEYRVRKSFKQLNVDYGEYAGAGGHLMITGEALSDLLSGKFSASAKLESVKPDTLEAYVVKNAGRRLPITFVGEVEADKDHVVNAMTLYPDSVLVYAPAEVLDTLSCVRTLPQQLVGLSDTTTVLLELEKSSRGMLFKPSEAALGIQVTPFVKSSFVLPVRPYMFPYEYTLRTFPSKAEVSFMVSLQQLRSVSAEAFELVVNYIDLDEQSAGKAKLELVKQPKGIRSVKIEPAEVDYLLEKSMPLKRQDAPSDTTSSQGNGH